MPSAAETSNGAQLINHRNQGSFSQYSEGSVDDYSAHLDVTFITPQPPDGLGVPGGRAPHLQPAAGRRVDCLARLRAGDRDGVPAAPPAGAGRALPPPRHLQHRQRREARHAPQTFPSGGQWQTHHSGSRYGRL